MNTDIRVASADQACALGAAMFAATVAGIYKKVEHAMESMSQGFEITYHPDPSRAAYYETKYRQYKSLAG